MFLISYTFMIVHPAGWMIVSACVVVWSYRYLYWWDVFSVQYDECAIVESKPRIGRKRLQMEEFFPFTLSFFLIIRDVFFLFSLLLIRLFSECWSRTMYSCCCSWYCWPLVKDITSWHSYFFCMMIAYVEYRRRRKKRTRRQRRRTRERNLVRYRWSAWCNEMHAEGEKVVERFFFVGVVLKVL